MCLDWSWTELNCLCGPNPDRWHDTLTHCWHYFSRIIGLLYPILSSWSMVFYCTFDSWIQPGLKQESFINDIPLFFIVCLNSYSRTLDRWPPLYTSMILKIIDGIWYDISMNPTRTYIQYEGNAWLGILHIWYVCTTMQPESITGLWGKPQQQLLPIELLVKTLLFSWGSMPWTRNVTEVTILPAYQFSMIIDGAYS